MKNAFANLAERALTASLCVTLFAVISSVGHPYSIAAAQTGGPIKIGTPGNDAAGLVYYAADMGFFTQSGLDANVQTLPRGGGAGVAAAVTGGSLDIGEADLVAIAAARSHGLKLTILAPSGWYSSAKPTTELVVDDKSPIRKAKDLEGKTIAVGSLEGPSKLAADAWLDQNGVDPTKVKFVELPPPVMPANLARGSIDAAVIPEPNLARAKLAGRVIAHPFDAIGKQWLISAWVSTADWVAQHPEAAKAFVHAMHDAAVWANDPRNRPRSAEILEKYTHIAPDLVQHMTRATYGLGLENSTMQPLLSAAYHYGSLTKSVDPQDLISPVALAR